MTNFFKHVFTTQLQFFQELFQAFRTGLDEELSEKHELFIRVVEMAKPEQWTGRYEWQGKGRRREERFPIALAFIAKAVYNYPTTRVLLENLRYNATLRRLCGWERKDEIPSEATFSRAFEQFARGEFAQQVHESMIRTQVGDKLIGHVSRDATAIVGREKPSQSVSQRAAEGSDETAQVAAAAAAAAGEPVDRKDPPATPEAATAPPDQDTVGLPPAEGPAALGAPAAQTAAPTPPKRQRGRPRKAETAAPTPPKRQRGRPRKDRTATPPPSKRLDLQPHRTLAENLADLPTACDKGTKRDARGYQWSWVGYKLHLDVIDGQIPASAILTSASLHDSQAAIPLAQMTAGRIAHHLYDLQDAAYDAEALRQFSRDLGHVPLIDHNPRRGQPKAMAPAEAVRYRERTSVERVNADLKDNHGGRTVRVRGATKVMLHLMFGVIVVAVKGLCGMLT